MVDGRLRGRVFRELLQLQLCRVSVVEALEAVAEELDLEALRAIHARVRRGGAAPGEALGEIAPEARTTLRRADESGDFETAFRELAELPLGEAPPAGTLAGDLFLVYDELARRLESEPIVQAAQAAAELPVREELKEALREISAENSFIRAMKERPGLFSPTARLMVRRTEECGKLQLAFMILADGVKAGAYLSSRGKP